MSMTRVDRRKPVLAATRPRTAPRKRIAIKAILEQAFRAEFPHDTVDISDGYKGNIHIVVVSKRFERMNDRIRQDFMWSIVDGSSLTAEEKQLISLLYPVTPSEIK
jgi:hypothetical protein